MNKKSQEKPYDICSRSLLFKINGGHSRNFLPNKIVPLVSNTFNSLKWFKVNREIIIFGKIKVERECKNGIVST